MYGEEEFTSRIYFILCVIDSDCWSGRTLCSPAANIPGGPGPAGPSGKGEGVCPPPDGRADPGFPEGLGGGADPAGRQVRRIREFFRHHRDFIEPCSDVVFAVRPGFVPDSPREVEAAVQALLARRKAVGKQTASGAVAVKVS